MPTFLPIVSKADKALEAVKDWAPMPNMPAGAQGYVGTAPNWRFIVASFDVDDSVGYDGTGTLSIAGGTTILRLPRELAEKGFKLAQKQTAS